jgi:uncharacterized damage-inducible protein DinB
MTVPFPEPTAPAGSRAEVFSRYLGYFRDRLAAKLRGLPEQELRHSRLLSGWTPIELLKHLTFVETRWLEWGFEGRDVADPWGDQREDRWHVAPQETLDELLAALDAQAERSRAVIAAHDLDEATRPPPWSGSCSTCSRSTPVTWGTWTSSASWPAARQANNPPGRAVPTAATAPGPGWASRRGRPGAAAARSRPGTRVSARLQGLGNKLADRPRQGLVQLRIGGSCCVTHGPSGPSPREVTRRRDQVTQM